MLPQPPSAPCGDPAQSKGWLCPAAPAQSITLRWRLDGSIASVLLLGGEQWCGKKCSSDCIFTAASSFSPF